MINTGTACRVTDFITARNAFVSSSSHLWHNAGGSQSREPDHPSGFSNRDAISNINRLSGMGSRKREKKAPCCPVTRWRYYHCNRGGGGTRPHRWRADAHSYDECGLGILVVPSSFSSFILIVYPYPFLRPTDRLQSQVLCPQPRRPPLSFSRYPTRLRVELGRIYLALPRTDTT